VCVCVLVCVISIKQNQHTHTHIHQERDRECYKNLAKTATNAAHVRFYYVKCLLGPTGPGRTSTSPSTTTVTCAVCFWFYFSCNSVFLYIVVVTVVVNVQLSLLLSHFTFHIHSTSVTGRNWPQRILFYARAKKVCNTISQNSVQALFFLFCTCRFQHTVRRSSWDWRYFALSLPELPASVNSPTHEQRAESNGQIVLPKASLLSSVELSSFKLSCLDFFWRSLWVVLSVIFELLSCDFTFTLE